MPDWAIVSAARVSVSTEHLEVEFEKDLLPGIAHPWIGIGEAMMYQADYYMDMSLIHI